MDEKLLTVTQAAQKIGIQPGALRDTIARGRIQVIRVGGQGKRAGFTFIHRTEVDRYIEEVRGKRGPKKVTKSATIKDPGPVKGGSSLDYEKDGK